MNVIESKIAGLGFLQAIIARMANNSFYIKGWDLTLFVALVALKKDVSQYSSYLLLALRKVRISRSFLPKLTR